MIETKLYLGRSRKSGIAITNKHIEEFLNRHVVPNFDFTIIQEARGCWKGSIESAIILEIIHDPEDTIRSGIIDNIAESYAILFDQECVLRTDRQVDSRLIENKTEKLDRTDGNVHVHPAFSSILEKAKHNVPWPGQTEVIVTKL